MADRAVMERMRAGGASLAQIAAVAGVTRQRVHQLAGHVELDPSAVQSAAAALESELAVRRLRMLTTLEVKGVLPMASLQHRLRALEAVGLSRGMWHGAWVWLDRQAVEAAAVDDGAHRVRAALARRPVRMLMSGEARALLPDLPFPVWCAALRRAGLSRRLRTVGGRRLPVWIHPDDARPRGRREHRR